MKICKKVSVVIQAALIAYAIQMRYSAVLNKADFKSELHYLYAEVTNLLGNFGFVGLLLFALAIVFICWIRQNDYEKYYRKGVLPFFFSFCLLMGQSYAQLGDWSGCFGSVFRGIGFLMAFLGYAALFRYLIALFLGLYEKSAASGWSKPFVEKFLGEKCFWNVFLLLLILWAPVIILSYPTNYCYDFLGQVLQSLGLSGYSAHHPLLHTLIAGGVIKLGRGITGSANFGIFLYTILQAAALAAALAATVARLTKRRVSCVLRLVTVGIYVFAPMYSNMASTAIKDVPFMAAMIWYLLLLEELVTEGAEGRPRLYWIKLVLVQVLTGLLRNNGIYVVVLTGIVMAVRYGIKRQKRRGVKLLLCTAIIPFVLYFGANFLMTEALSAEKGSVAEMFSVPFQQTARYLRDYGYELTDEERRAIEGVLGDVDAIVGRYDPDISDPVKALYRRDAGAGQLAAYFKTWFRDFFKHPDSYFQAFFAHVYGWFDPGVTNSIRYEAETDGLFREGGLIRGVDKVLLFVYRFVAYIPFLEILENVGIYTWLLLILAGAAMRKREARGILLAPLFISLLICMASPCFYLHPRYAYPIMFTIPFLYGILSGGLFNEANTDKADV